MQHELIDDLRAAAVANVGLALVDVINEQRLLTDTSTLQGLVAEVDQELHGLGPLATFVQPGVTDILAAMGIWEFGRFAGRYRRHFGELPSETLKRARG